MYAACFGLHLGYPREYQHKNIYRKIQYKSKGPILHSLCMVLK